MKAIQKIFDNIKPNFQKGGKLEKLHSVYDGFYTFMFVPAEVTKSGTHVRDTIDMKRTMIIVVLAMVPALLFGMWNVGYQHFVQTGADVSFMETFMFGAIRVLPIVVVSYGVGLAIEFAVAQMKGHPINEGYLVSGMLIPLVLPVDIPLWMVAAASAFAVIIGKEVFGGSGMNLLNPALTARAFLFFAYPTYMSGNRVWVADSGTVDGVTGETILGSLAAGTNVVGTAVEEAGMRSYSVMDAFLGFIPGSIGETSTLAILIGAAILIITGIGSWRIMFSALIGGAVMGFIFNAFAVNALMALPWWQHIVVGGFAFGVVFMATDPVSAAQTTKGKWIYGFLVGFFAIMIRVFNPAYPEGIMLAILLMNVFAPLIDHYVVEGNMKKRLKRLKSVKA
jgi:Na+-transporting NADH:ubiquinone oxidoreductase subunit B